MKFEEIKQRLIESNENEKLISEKHDPDRIEDYDQVQWRSVVSKAMKDNMRRFIEEEKYSMDEYKNSNYPNSPLYLTIKPLPGSGMDIPASGVTGSVPTEQFDTLIVVSGSSQGLHIMGDSSNNISEKIRRGKLTHIKKLK